MTKRTRLLAASLLSSLSCLSLAACSSSGNGGTIGVGGAAGNSSGGLGTSGGASSTLTTTGGASTVSANTGGSATIIGYGGSSPAAGGVVGTGGATLGSGGAILGSGGTVLGSGGAMLGSGGATASSGGSTGESSCVAGVQTDDPCDPVVDSAVCVRSTRDCTCSASGSWVCVSNEGTGGRDGSGGSTASSGGSTGSGGSASTECVLPDFPDVESLPRNDKLPDPFTFFDGVTKVTTKAQWECRRREIQAMAAKYIYGPYPFEPDETTGTVSGNDISITCKEGSKTETFSASISGSGDVITIDMSSGILPSSRKTLSFGSGFESKIKSLFGLSEMNTNVATGWMVDRVIEVLEQNPGSGHDPTKMAVSGCSGCGKGAFLVGVFSRIPMVVVVESGGGGAASLRQAEWFRHGEGQAIYQCLDQGKTTYPQSIDNLEDTGICGPWVTSAASKLRANPELVYNLPFDQHLLLATIAPRYLVHFSNNHGVNSWCHLGGTCEALSAWAAKPVWDALGVPDNMAFEMYNGTHCSVGDTGIAAAMFKRAFEGDTSAKTGGVKIMDNGVQQPVSEWKDMWIDWDMATVLE